MSTTADYLTQLQQDREDLVDNLETQGISDLTGDETFTELVPRVLDIESGGGSLDYNIYVQNNEPTSNKGIWIKDNISYDEVMFNYEKISYLKSEYGANLPTTNREIGCVAIGTDIYLFGGQTANNTYSNKVYKFDTLTETYTEVATMPFSAYGIGTEYYNGNIYLFGGRNSSTLNTTYKYNITSKTFTQLANIPYSVGQLGTVIKDDNVYLIGGTSRSTQTANLYKYNITNNTYTQLTSIPSIRNTPAVCLLNNEIYIFGGFSGNSAIASSYKYNIANNTFTQLANLPKKIYGANAHVIGEDIYIFGGFDSIAYTTFYQYFVNTNSYSQFEYLLDATGRLSSAIVNNVFYNFGGVSNGSSSFMNKLQKIFFDDSIDNYISTKNALLINISPFEEKKVELLSNNVALLCNLKSVYFYSTTTGLNKNLDAYYNNDNEWKKID